MTDLKFQRKNEMTPTKIHTDTRITPSLGCMKETGYCNTDVCVAVAQRETCNAPNHHKPFIEMVLFLTKYTSFDLKTVALLMFSKRFGDYNFGFISP